MKTCIECGETKTHNEMSRSRNLLDKGKCKLCAIKPKEISYTNEQGLFDPKLYKRAWGLWWGWPRSLSPQTYNSTDFVRQIPRKK